MKFTLPFKKSPSSTSIPEDPFPPRYTDTRPLKAPSRGCLAIKTDTAALLFTVLTIGNGLISLVGGVQYFAAGGSLVPHLDALQTGAGGVMVVLSMGMLGVLLTKLKSSRLLVLGYGLSYTLLPIAVMIALAVFLGLQNASKSIQQLIVDECSAALTTSPFTDVSVTQLRDACSQDNAEYLRRTVMWTGIRAGIQVLFSSVIGFWTISHFLGLSNPSKLYDDDIPFTTRGQEMGKDDYSDPFASRSPYQGQSPYPGQSPYQGQATYQGQPTYQGYTGYQAYSTPTPAYQAPPYRPGLGSGYQH